MTIPALPTYSDYEIMHSGQHPATGYYVGLYRQISSFQVSLPHSFRISVFSSDGNLTELYTRVTQYTSQWSSPNYIISEYDDLIWLMHPIFNIESLRMNANGTLTSIGTWPQYTAGSPNGWISAFAETPTHIWITMYNQYQGAYVKSATPGLLTLASGQQLSPANSNWNTTATPQHYYVLYMRDVDTMLVYSAGANAVAYDATTFSLRGSRDFDSNIGVTPSLDVVDTNQLSSYEPAISQVRNGNKYWIDVTPTGVPFGTEERASAVSEETARQALVNTHSVLAWWEFNEADGATHFRERSGNQYDAALTGLWELEQPPIFNAHDDLENFSADSNNIAWASTGLATSLNSITYTLEAWVMFNSLDANFVPIIGNTDGDATSNSFYIGIYKSAANKIGARIWNYANYPIESPNTVEIGRMYHIVATQDHVIGLKLYIDGKLIGIADIQNGSNVTIDAFAFNHSSNNDYVTDMTIGEVVIYDEPLAESEVLALYVQGTDDARADTYAGDVLALDPIVYYPCDDNGDGLVDMSGGGNHLMPVGSGMTYQQPGIPDGGTAVQTSGAIGSSFLSDPISFIGRTQFSIEMWMKWDGDNADTAGSDIKCLFRLQDSDAAPPLVKIEFIYNYSDNTVYLQFYSASPSMNSKELGYAGVYPDVWHHFVARFNSVTDIHDMWIDGIRAISTNNTVTPYALDMILSIADGYFAASDFPLKGAFQHIAIYPISLTEQQILDHYSRGSQITLVPDTPLEEAIMADNPMCFWPLDDTTGSVAVDKMQRRDLDIIGSDAATLTTSDSRRIVHGSSTKPCFTFNGSSQYLQVDDFLPVGSYDEFTFEFMSYASVLFVTQEPIGTYEAGGYTFAFKSDNTVYVKFLVEPSTTASLNPVADTIQRVHSTIPNHWMVTWDGTNLVVYRDGYQFAVENVPTATGRIEFSTGTKFTVGAQYDAAGASNYFNGQLQNVAIYNKVLTRADALKRHQLMYGYDVANFPANSIKRKIYDSGPTFFYPLDNTDTLTNKAMPELMRGYDTEYLNHGGYISYTAGRPLTKTATFLNDGFETESRVFRGVVAEDMCTISLATRYNPNWDTDFGQGFTFEIFFKTSATTPYSCILSLNSSTPAPVIFIAMTSTGAIYTVAGLSPYQQIGTFGEGYNDGVGHHLVLTHNGLAGASAISNVYVDGVNIGQLTGCAVLYTDIAEARIGGYQQQNTAFVHWFEGEMSCAALYDLVLPTADIEDHFLTAFGLSAAVSDDYSALVIADSPLAYYRMNESIGSSKIYDTMLNFHGIAEDVTFEEPSGVGIATDNSAKFIGNDAYATLPVGILQDSDDFTIEFWFKLNAASDVVSLRRGSDTAGGWGVSIGITRSHLNFAIVTMSGGAVANTIAPPYPVTIGEWHHIACTFEQGVDSRIYFDGFWVGYRQFTATTMRTSTIGININRVPEDLTSVFSGSVDELAIYDTVLSGVTIRGRFLEGMDRHPFDELVWSHSASWWWDFDRDDQSVDNVWNDRAYWQIGNYYNGATDALHPCRLGSTKSAYFADHTTNPYITVNSGFLNTATIFSYTVTFETWVELDYPNIGLNHAAIFCDGGYQKGLFIGAYNGEFGVWLRNNTTLVKAALSLRYITQGQPMHVVVSVSNGLKLYINGKLHRTTIGVTDDWQGTSPSAIGRIGTDNQSPATGTSTHITDSSWQGYIDDVIVYNTPLTDTQVKEHYDAGTMLNSYINTLYTIGLPTFYFPCDDELVGGALDAVSGDLWTNHGDAVDSADGYLDRAYVFNGDAQTNGDSNPVGNFISSGALDVTHIDFSQVNTVAMWVKISKKVVHTSTVHMLMSQSSTGGSHYVYAKQAASGTGCVLVVNQAHVSNSYSTETIDEFPYDTWTHVAYSFDISGGDLTVKIYINGVEVSAYSEGSYFTPFDPSGYTSGAEAIRFGEHVTATDSYHHTDGLIDEIVFYQGVRTASEIEEIYNATGTDYRIFGTVTQDESPVERLVRLYRRDNGKLVKETTSPGGEFDIRWKYLDPTLEYYAVAFDDDNAPLLQPISQDRLMPVVVV